MERQGKVQRAIIRWLQEYPERNVYELARLIHSREETANERRVIRQAIKSLIEAGLVEKGGYYHNGATFMVTQKARKRPDQMKLPAIALVKTKADR